MEGEEGRQESERPGKRRAILQGLKNRWLPFWREVIYIYRRLTSRFSNSFGGRIMRFEERERRKEFFSMETRARDFEETFRGGMFVERLRCSMSCCYL